MLLRNVDLLRYVQGLIIDGFMTMGLVWVANMEVVVKGAALQHHGHRLRFILGGYCWDLSIVLNHSFSSSYFFLT